jgi:Protein of unknown function (DUF1800)
VIRAILFDPEVWDGQHLTNPQWGKPREPMIKAAHVVRSLSCKAASGQYKMGTLQATNYDLGQPPLLSNSVFNYFQGDHIPQGELADLGMTAPEYQITNNSTMIGYTNYVWSLLGFGLFTNENSLVCNYSDLTPLANQPDALVSKLAARFMGTPLSATARQTILDAVNSVPFDGSTQAKENRVKTAIMLMATSPDYNVQR